MVLKLKVIVEEKDLGQENDHIDQDHEEKDLHLVIEKDLENEREIVKGK